MLLPAILRQPFVFLNDNVSFKSWRHSKASSIEIASLPTVARSSFSTATIPVDPSNSNFLMPPCLATEVPASLYEQSLNDSERTLDELLPVWTHPDYIIPGGPGIIKHHLLNNKRLVVTKNSNNDIELWDIIRVRKWLESWKLIPIQSSTTKFPQSIPHSFLFFSTQCIRLKSFDQADFNAVVERENSSDWVSSWCTLDSNLGVESIWIVFAEKLKSP